MKRLYDVTRRIYPRNKIVCDIADCDRKAVYSRIHTSKLPGLGDAIYGPFFEKMCDEHRTCED